MEYLNNYFDKIYVITVRDDRFEKTKNLLDSKNIKYKKIKGILGETITTIEENEKIRFTKGAIGLLKTTEKIIKDAIKNEYKKILIFEDDIIFDPNADFYIKMGLDVLPENFDLVFLGVKHNRIPEKFKPELVKVKDGYCCHAYGINSTIFEEYLEKLKECKKPIDHYTNEIIMNNKNSYAIRPSMVYQNTDYSNIINKLEDKNFLYYSSN